MKPSGECFTSTTGRSVGPATMATKSVKVVPFPIYFYKRKEQANQTTVEPESETGENTETSLDFVD